MKAFSTYFSDSRFSHWCCLIIFALFTMNSALANHDDCSGAIALVCGDIISGNNEGATTESLPTCGMVFPGQTLWYSIAGTGGDITASTCSPDTDFDTQLGIFSGSCGALTCVAGNNNDLGCDNPRFSTVTWSSTAGTTYYIVVAGVLGASGDFELSIDCEDVAPPNDLCADAESIECGDVVIGNTETASSEPGIGTCGTDLSVGPGVWYSFAGTGDMVTVATCGSSFDTKLGVFTGSCGDLSCVDGNDDDCGLQSSVTFVSSVGVTYSIFVTGFGSAAGDFELSITCEDPLENDICEDALLVECGDVVFGSTEDATTTSISSCGTTLNTSGGVWYEFEGDGSTVTLTTCNPGTNYDTKIGVFSGDCGDLVCVDGNDDQGGGFDPACNVTGNGFNRGSTVVFETEDGVSYFILVTGFSSNTGDFEMTVDCLAPPPPPPTPSTCDDATEFFCGDVISGDTRTGSINTLSCGPGAANNLSTAPGLWYSFEGNNSLVTLNTCSPNTDFDIKLGVFAGSCDALACVGVSSNLGLANCPFLSGRADEVTFAAFAGITYYVYVTGVVGASGLFDMFVDCAPVNDDCVNALTIECGETASGSTEDASSDTYPGCGTAFSTAPGVWYTFTGIDGSMTLSTCNAGTDYDTKLFLFEGACGALNCIAGNDDDFGCGFSSLRSTITFNPVDGATYYVLVNGFSSSSTGDFELRLSCNFNTNFVCTDAQDVECGDIVSGTTVDTGSESLPNCGGTTLNTSGTVWYHLVGTGDEVTVTTCNPGSNFDTKIGVFTGSCGSLVCVTGDDDDPCPFSGLRSRVNFLAEDGVSYFIVVTGFGSNEGNYELSIECEDPTPIPACAAATEIFCDEVVAGSTVGAPITDLASCGTALNTSPGVWYKFTGLGDNVTLSTCTGTAYDSKIGVYTGSCFEGGLVCVGGNDDACGLQSSVGPFAAMNGVTYYIYVSGFGGQSGAFELTVECEGMMALVGGNDNGLSEINTTQINPTEYTKDVSVGDFYPNPSAHNANIQIYAPVEAEAQIQLFDAVGHLAHRSEIDLYSGVNTVELQVANLAVGTYFAKIVIGKEAFQKKLVIVK